MTSESVTKAEAAPKGPPLIDLVRDEVQALIGRSKDGLLPPADLLAWARKNKQSATYQYLDRKAFSNKDVALDHALLLCGRLIRRIKVRVEMVRNEPQAVRAYVSLDRDRRQGAGYRRLEAVMASDELRQELLATAEAEAQSFAIRNRRFEEMAPIVSAIDGYFASRPPKKG